MRSGADRRTLPGTMTLEVPPAGTHGTRMPSGPIVRFGSRVAAAVYRLSGGRISPHALLLTTVGAKSGEPRVAMIARFDAGDGKWLVVGSNNGSARHPSWLRNVAAHPDQVWIEFGDEKHKVRPEILRGEERAAAWEQVVREAPQFGTYTTKTDREIPVVRLTREPA
jgi:deazaflavin-dependent oxidoreductase (nitroreductase family)